MFRLEGVPRSILILYPVFLIFLLGGPRLGYRLWKDHDLSFRSMLDKKRVLVIGAGSAAEILIREIMRKGSYLPVAILDDNTSLKGSEIHGIKIYGEVKHTPEMVDRFDSDLILIAIPSATSEQMQSIIEICGQTNLPVRTLPGIQDMVGRVGTLSELRDVSIEDLLGREKVELNWQEIQKGISNKIVFVTGGGGSIGSELCLQIASLGPSDLIIFERSEFNLYNIGKEISFVYPELSLHCILGDLCDIGKVDYVIKHHKPDLIFHAAAYKHVPILEKEPGEAVRNNISGTKNIVDMAVKYSCSRFVLISTDKAVNPTNVLGFTKKIAELYTEWVNSNSSTTFITVRFGNVLDSDGSVVPLFREQIHKGGPITVTHPEVTRFFMTIREACQLILQTGSMGNGGEIYVLDMGKPVKINYLAEQMIRLSGLIPGRDIEIKYTGLRAGEKMYEELFYDNEIRDQTAHKKIKLARNSSIQNKNINNEVNEIIDLCLKFDDQKILSILKKIVPVAEDKNDNIISINEKSI
ncbi:MAG: nucleoside-diphosphate sugar epimerase/dehydratase [Proteobacteria bacterium]|nr:nucleoside-diphosphate sugar epimerase/dehydratase [Pseudomonadota bacterium]